MSKAVYTYLIVFAVAIALSFVVYANTLSGSFVYDDGFFSTRADLKSPSALVSVWSQPYLPQHKEAGTYRPLTVVTFALNFLLLGDNPQWFHLVSILLHGSVVFLVFCLVLKLFKNKALAVFSALIFVVLPIHTEAVAFIKARDELLATALVLSAWLLFLRATSSKGLQRTVAMALSVASFALAVLAKETVILAPLAFVAVYHIQHSQKIRQSLRLALPYAATIVVLVFVRYLVLGGYAFGSDDAYYIINPIADAPILTRIWTACAIAFLYISKTFVPIGLSASYHFRQLMPISNPLNDFRAVAGLVMLVGLGYLVWWPKTRGKAFGLGALSFLVFYAVISKFFFSGGDVMGERWLYLSSVGLSIMAGYAFLKLYQKSKPILIIALILALGSWGFIAVRRNRVWLSEEALYKSMLVDAPLSVQSHTNMATLYLERNDIEAARREVEQAYGLFADHPPLLNLIGIIATKDGNYPLAEAALLRAIELRPTLPISYSNIARLYYNAGEYTRAETMLKEVAFKFPQRQDRVLYAVLLAKLHLYQNSLDFIENYLPNDLKASDVRFVIAVNYFKMGNRDKAREYFDWNPSKSEAEKLRIIEDF